MQLRLKLILKEQFPLKFETYNIHKPTTHIPHTTHNKNNMIQHTHHTQQTQHTINKKHKKYENQNKTMSNMIPT